MRMVTLSLYILAFAIVAYGGKLLVDHSRPVPTAPVGPTPRDRFASCFESVEPRMQFVCRDGTIWTRTITGWSVDRSASAMPGIDQG